jgi:purine-cytosine permease-like protein
MIGGQILSAVNGAGMTIIVGIVVVQIIAWIVAVFGMKIFHHYERFAWIPQLLVLFVLIGSAGPYFDPTVQSVGEPSVVAANRLSFLSLCLYVPNSWGAAASDFYVYYLVGLWVSFSLVYMLGIGLATGLANNTAWADANAVSTGGLIVAGFGPLNGFGLFCAVIIALGVIANSIPGTYSAALGCQVMGRCGKAVPRWVWSCILILIELVLAIAGREHLLVVMQNFLALMGYWMEFMVFIVLMEHLIFRRLRPEPIDWARWEDKSHLPIGIAALVAFLLGWLGAVLGMYQIWYTGPIAVLAGPADVGVWVGSGFTIISYIPLRYVELRYLKR